MTSPAPTPLLTTYQDHQLLSAADLNGMSNHLGQLYNYTMGGFKNKKPICMVSTSTNKAQTSGVDHFLAFDVASPNTDGMWVSTSPAQFTIVTAGWYRIVFSVYWDTNKAGQRGCAILVNGTSISTNAVASDSRSCNQTGDSFGTSIICEAVVHLAAGSIVYPYITQNSGSNTVTANIGSQMSFEWVAPY